MTPPRLAALLPALLCCGAVACGTKDPPKPTRVDQKPLISPPRRPERTGPFRNPSLDPPPPRSEPQLAPKALADTLTKARAQIDAGTPDLAILTLRTCANRVPPSAQCEGELAMLLADKPAYKAEFTYYLQQACDLDAPDASPDYFRRLAQVARRKGNFPAAAQAMAHAIDHGADTAEDHAFLAQTLSSTHENLPQAIDAYRVALAKAPKRHQWRYELGSLLAQVNRPAQAIKELRAFQSATRGQDPRRDARIDAWVQELERTTPVPPTAPKGAK